MGQACAERTAAAGEQVPNMSQSASLGICLPSNKSLNKPDSGSKHCEPRVKAKIHCFWEGKEAIFTAPVGEVGNPLTSRTQEETLYYWGRGEETTPYSGMWLLLGEEAENSQQDQQRHKVKLNCHEEKRQEL